MNSNGKMNPGSLCPVKRFNYNPPQRAGFQLYLFSFLAWKTPFILEMYKPVWECMIILSKLLDWVVHTIINCVAELFGWNECTCLSGATFFIFPPLFASQLNSVPPRHLTGLWQFTKLSLGRLWRGSLSCFHVTLIEPSWCLSLLLNIRLVTALTS